MTPNDMWYKSATQGTMHKGGNDGNIVRLHSLFNLKVMAKDRLHVKVDYYAVDETTDNSNANGLSALTSVLTGLLDNNPIVAGMHGSGSVITGNLNNVSAFTSFLSNQSGSGGTSLPKAYLNIVFFDEQFRFVGTNSEIIQITTKGSGQTITRIDGSAKEAPKNGYAYIYVSNESNNMVYFDNFQVKHERGPITEETHYYAFGLSMSGISSKAMNFGDPNNRIKVFGKELQSKEFADGSGIEWYDYGMREYNHQIGRFFRIDPISEKFYYLSPYQYCSNDPIKNVDLDGAEGMDFRIWTKLAANKVQNPNGTSAKILGTVVGTGGAVGGVVHNVVNAVTHPLETAKGLIKMAGQSPSQLAVNYGLNLYSQYGNSGSESFTNFATVAHASTDIFMVLSPMKGAFASKSASVWEMASYTERGFKIEAMLGGNLPKAFPVIDKLKDGVATSIKSIDLTAETYGKGNNLLNTLKGYINKLDNFTTGTREGVTVTQGVDFSSKALEVAIQPGKASLSQWEQISKAMQYAKDNNIQFNLQFIK